MFGVIYVRALPSSIILVSDTIWNMTGWIPKISTTAGKISTNVFYQLLGKVIGAGTTFFITTYLAHLFGPHGYGDVVKIVTYVSGFFIISDFGFNAIYLKDAQKVYALPSLILLRTVLSFVLVCLSYLLLRVIPIGAIDGYTSSVRFGILLYAPAILFQTVITTVNAVFQKHLRYDYSLYAISCGSIVSLFALFILPKFFFSPSVIGATIYLSASITTSIAAFLFLQRLENISMHINVAYTKVLLLSSIPVGITLVANILYAHADSVVLTLTRTTREVGTYGLAYRFFETLLVIPTFVMNAAYPILLTTSKHSPVSLFHRYKKLVISLFTLSIVVAVVSWICAPLLSYIRLDFIESVDYIRILILSLPFYFLSSLMMWMLFIFNKRWELACIYIIAMAVNIGANILLVPDHGAMYSAWITVYSEGLVLAATYSLVSRMWKTNI